MTDDQMKKYIKQAITELDKAHEKRSKEKDQEADKRIEATLKRHIGALTEDFNDKLSGVAEMVGGLMVDVTEVKSGMTEVKHKLDIIQSDVEIIKNDLKQKVDRSEFEALVKRVSFVEKKISTR